MEGSVQLIFAGEVLDGFDAADVRRRLGELLKLDDKRLAMLFSGSQVVIKRGLNPELASHWVSQFRAMGALLHAQQVVAAPVPIGAAALPSAPAVGRDGAAPAPSPILVNTLPPSEEITCPNCGERQPKRILCRSCATDMPRGIAAKEEEAAAERARRREEALARRGVRPAAPTPRRATPVLASEDDAPLFGLSFTGRIGRMRNFLGGLLILTLMVWLGFLVALMPGGFTLVLLILGMAFMLVWGCRLTVLRLHDINRSAWWALLFFVPYLGGLASLALSLWPGDPDENEHGAPPSDGGSLAAVGVLVLLFLSVTIGWKMAWSAVQREAAAIQAGAEEDEPSFDEEATLPRSELARVLGSDAAVDEFRRYSATPAHRAFAVSDGGAWGWHGGAARPDQAIETALADCEHRRAPYTSSCRLVHLNHQWAMN